MSLSTCCGCEPHLTVYAIAAVLLFFAPVGAFVLRKHIDSAAGGWRVAGRLLQALAALSTPFAVLLVLSVLLQIFG